MRSTLLILFFLASIPLAANAGPVQAVAKSVTGKATWAAPGSTQFSNLAIDQKLPMGSTVKTGADGEVVLVTMPGMAVRLGADARLVISELDFQKGEGKIVKRKTALDLQSGTLSALIEKHDPKNTDFTVKTPQGVAAARGTFFAVTVDEGNAFVAVKEGQVGVRQPGAGKSSKEATPEKPK
ncbi:MAG: FecR family protein [Verrucomicrobiae bacterium]|nr:FecR family protein [Verrucomicrobiae bacterium]